MKRNLLAAGAALLLAACGGDAPSAAGPAVHDSAGVRIVENAGPAWPRGQAWRVDDEPLAAVGVADGDPRYQFGSVGDALRLSDGTLVVADAQAGELRVFDARGRWLRTLGRKGGGPGEFNAVWSLFLLAGDTVAAYDPMAARLTVFAPAGVLARTVALKPLEGGLSPRPVAVGSDGSMLVVPGFNPVFASSPEPSRDSIPLARYTAAGEPAAALGRIAGMESVTIVGGSGNDRVATRGNVPFGGNTFVAAHGPRLLIADNARYELAEHAADGRLVRLVRRRVDPEPVTEADRAAWAERARARSDARFRQVNERLIAATPFPEHKAAFADVRLDAAAHAWVQRNGAGDGPTPWDVFDPEGRFLGTVQTPAGLRVTQVGADFVVGVASDALDVPQVRVHRIHKPGVR
jgi:hypothetical protein